MPSGVNGDWDGKGILYPMVLKDGSTYKMWYTGREVYGPGRVGYATSPNGLDWTVFGSNPVLDVGSPGSWDADDTEAPFVLKTGPSNYLMYYSGWPDCGIGVATSTNGTSWNKYGGNPVLSPGGDDWNNVCVIHPFVLYEGGTYKMWMLSIGNDGSGDAPYLGYATSPNGLSWTWHSASPLFGPTWEGFFWRPALVNDGSTYHLWHTVFTDEVVGISYASSISETDFTKYGDFVLNGDEGDWENGLARDPFVIKDSGTYTMWYDNNYAIGVATSSNATDWTKYGSNPVLSPSGDPGLFIDVNYGHDWVEGNTGVFQTVFITVTDSGGSVKATVQMASNSFGWFGTHESSWDPEHPDIQPGDYVSTTVPYRASAEVGPIGMINAEVDYDNDIIYGVLDATGFVTTTVSCEIWQEGAPGINIEDVDTAGGEFTCDFSIGPEPWDLQLNQTIALRYFEPDGDTVLNVIEPDWARVNYGHDWVGVDYEAGHTFNITVTDGTRAVKGTAEFVTWPGGGWGGDGGETAEEDWTEGSPPDIDVGDMVYFQSDDGYSNTVEVGEITGDINVATDSISGYVNAPWLATTLDMECHPWGAYNIGIDTAEVKNSTAESDGSDPYDCSWDPVTEWDVQPGQDIAAMYIEPDLDRVINVFREPGPDLAVEKWTEGGDQVMAGGYMIYNVRVVNDGDAPALGVLTDTFPADSTYVWDSSGFPWVTTTTTVSWDLGWVEPGQEVLFYLVLKNTASPDDVLTNMIDVYDPLDFNYDNNHAEADVQVVDELPDVWVDKNPMPGDPVAGESMLYEINYGNNGPIPSGPVWMTDTIPAGTTVLNTDSVNGYDDLVNVIELTSERVVLYAPSLPGNWGDTILLQLESGSGTGKRHPADQYGGD